MQIEAPDCDLVQQISKLVVVLAEDVEGGQAQDAHHLGDIRGLQGEVRV